MTVEFTPDDEWVITSTEGEHYPQYGSADPVDQEDGQDEHSDEEDGVDDTPPPVVEDPKPQGVTYVRGPGGGLIPG